MNPAQYHAWLEHAGYRAEAFPFEMAMEILNDRTRGNYVDRRSLEIFLAGWNAAEEYRINTQNLTAQDLSIFKRI